MSSSSSESANAALPAVTPVNIISEKTTLRSCVLFINQNSIFYNIKNTGSEHRKDYNK
jgi:hypothetical protein